MRFGSSGSGTRLAGILLVVISATTFGTLPILSRYAYDAGLNVSTLLFLRFTLAALVLIGLLWLRREPLPRGGVLAQLIGMGAIGYVGQSYFYLSALQFASAGLVALLLYLYPTIVALLSVFVLKTRLTRLKAVALSIATLGLVLTANPQGGQWTGILLAVGAAVMYAVYIVVGAGVMQKVSAVQSTAVIFASAGLVYGGIVTVQGPQWPKTGEAWLVVGGLVVLATVIPVMTFLASLKRIGPTEVSMLSILEPVVTVLLAALLFQERLQPSALVGGGLILAAVWLLARGELRQADVIKDAALARKL